ncbi:MAG: UDP-N-acetylglucosamine 4,6-dehydratase (inverting) [Lachnospiraceae bacterium]|nr:UDP-N-acetylglucosamine 4,6-dehydratase (inverting) [Lachnospiraceae bacterium]MEE3460576.1 UDP-N-acetylglucosamine 4,6-dehydratase (inverting) [Lachnospiraceae bacterium]
MLNGKTILVTGGTGSFGHHFVEYALKHYEPKKIIIYSRDEYKQFVMANQYKDYSRVLRFFIGDVRDQERLEMAMKGVDYVIHAAALKQVPACEYNPNEAIKTNINGAMSVINASLKTGVRKVVALSTDKSVHPVNLYGATKMVSDKLFCAANAYSGADGTRFAVVRYGNVAGSRGSVIPFFKGLLDRGETLLPITDYRMTRFWISLEQGVELVIKALHDASGGEVFISKIPSFKITDLAEAMLPGVKTREVGIREGEKLHEVMITTEDAPRTYEYEKNYIIYPNYTWWDKTTIIPGGKLVEPDFEYSSGRNKEWLTVEELRERLKTDLDRH